jgi:hypothetical protein
MDNRNGTLKDPNHPIIVALREPPKAGKRAASTKAAQKEIPITKKNVAAALDLVLRAHRLFVAKQKGGIQLNLKDAYLCFAIFDGANLSGASFDRADFTLSKLSGANLTNADLRMANFAHANLSSANLETAFLLRAVYNKKFINCRNCPKS